MIPAGAKFWYALTGLALAAAALYFVSSGGEKYGTFVLAFAGIAGAVLGTTATVERDGDVPAPTNGEPVAESPRVESLPAIWPALGAVGAVVAVVGLAAGNALLWVGVAILAATLVEWMVQAWAERSTPDPAANLGLRNRMMFPIEIPALALIGAALVIVTVSRVLLALSARGAAAFATVIAVVILAIAAVLASKPRIGSSVLSGALVLGAVLLIAGGIVGGVVGEREFEHHEPAHAEDEIEPEPDADVTARGDRPDAANTDDERVPDQSAEEAAEDEGGTQTDTAGADDEGTEGTGGEGNVPRGDPDDSGDPNSRATDDTTAVSTP